jgi:hypothetical protein
VSLAGNHPIDSIIAQYESLHHDDPMHTFSAIVQYILDHLPNLQVAAKAASEATAQIMAFEVYLTLQAENATLKQQHASGNTSGNRN